MAADALEASKVSAIPAKTARSTVNVPHCAKLSTPFWRPCSAPLWRPRRAVLWHPAPPGSEKAGRETRGPRPAFYFAEVDSYGLLTTCANESPNIPLAAIGGSVPVGPPRGFIHAAVVAHAIPAVIHVGGRPRRNITLAGIRVRVGIGIWLRIWVRVRTRVWRRIIA